MPASGDAVPPASGDAVTPAHRTTGSRGYRSKFRSVSLSAQRTNVEPRAEVTTRA